MSVRQLDAEQLELGAGLEVLLQATLAGLQPGEVVDIRLASRNVALELPAWARLHGHAVVDDADDGPEGCRVRVERGSTGRILAGDVLAPSLPPPLRAEGRFHSGDMRSGDPAPDTVPREGGFAPLGSVPEPGAPRFDWRLHTRDEVWAPEVAELAEQSSGEQWDASDDVPWEAVRDVPEVLERAVAQVMTFIAQNEYAALYVPAGFLPQMHPAYAELVMWLASHVHDEARPIEVFTKRALIGGHHGFALASTELSLHSLLEEHDFTAAALLLNVLGEGHVPRSAAFRRAPRPRCRHCRSCTSCAPRCAPPRAFRDLARPLRPRLGSRGARAARPCCRAASIKADRAVAQSAVDRGADDHGCRVDAASSVVRRCP